MLLFWAVFDSGPPQDPINMSISLNDAARSGCLQPPPTVKFKRKLEDKEKLTYHMKEYQTHG
jgi:hypothetical protein